MQNYSAAAHDNEQACRQRYCPNLSAGVPEVHDEGTVQRVEEAHNVVVMAQRTASGSPTSDDRLPPDHQECKKGKAAYFKKLGKLLERP
jgi:hypothetical protein